MEVWLKSEYSTPAKVRQLKQKGMIPKGYKVNVEPKGGRALVILPMNPFDPLGVPDIPQEIVEKFSLHEMILTRKRRDGVYEMDSTVLLALTEVVDEHLVQDITISAPSLESLRQIYKLFREGKLWPTSDWEADDVSDIPSVESSVTD